jgi:asparagine N-glycosylation enzyme membrane subunit Stt3
VKRLAIGAAAFALAPAAALAADMSGVWTVHGTFGALKYTITCTFKQQGSTLSGPCTGGPTGENVPTTGKVNGTTVEFMYDTTYQGAPVHLYYGGMAHADGSITGAIDSSGAGGVFTATIARR